MGDVFLLVLAGHLLGDFVVQTDRQAADKGRSWRADLAHVLTYHLTMAGRRFESLRAPRAKPAVKGPILSV